jgi:putative FmdB family regulatory protein
VVPQVQTQYNLSANKLHPEGLTVPIYEFYCGKCHTVFSFFSRTVNTAKRPACPRCGLPELERQMSSFAISKGAVEGEAKDDYPQAGDEAALERAIEDLARETESSDQDDPRQAARVLRKLCETSGMTVGGKMEEAIRRMEAGEDPEKLEEDLGDVFDEELPGSSQGGRVLRGLARKLRPPTVDRTLYDL